VSKGLEQADLRDVTVAEDRDKNTITLGGKVHSDDARAKAGDVAKINDLDACVAGRGQNSRCGPDGFLNHRNVESRTVKQATLGAEVILHVDDDHCSLCHVDRNRFGLRIEPDDASFLVSLPKSCDNSLTAERNQKGAFSRAQLGLSFCWR